jgi:basic membrane protein A
MKNLHMVAAILVATGYLIPGCTSKNLDCNLDEVMCVGLVTEVGRRDDHAYNQAAWEGILEAKSAGTADRVASIETMNARDYEVNINLLAEAGYDVIVTVGSAMGKATQAMAREYPDSHFIGVDQDQLPDQVFIPNLAGLVFAEDQIGYLAGAMAALMSKTSQIGAILGSDELPSMKLYGEGFLAGAAYINPEIVTAVVYHNEVGLDMTMVDPDWGAKKAVALVGSGTDIIFATGGTTGTEALLAALRGGAYGIGADYDQTYVLPDVAARIYMSVLKLIAPGITELIKTTRASKTETSGFPSGNYYGQVGLSSYHDLDSSIPEAVKARMAELNQALNSGEIQTGVLMPNP